MNLVLVHQRTKQDPADYREIAARVGTLAPEIRVHVVDTKDSGVGAGFDTAAPTLTVSPMPIKRFAPPRGPICQGFEFPKSEQYRRLSSLGFPVPDWAELAPGICLDPAHRGPYVAVKPDLGRKGAEVHIKRTGRVRYRVPKEFPPEHPIHKGPLIAQRFIYTGAWPANYRVVTLFGRRLMCWRCEADHRYVPLRSRWDFRAKGDITVVSNKPDSRYTLAFDEDVISLAERAHAAFPDQPVLGSDIVRDADTGELYVIECNPRGDAWLIGSDMGRMIEQANGLRFAAQFAALVEAEQVLARVTRARAG